MPAFTTRSALLLFALLFATEPALGQQRGNAPTTGGTLAGTIFDGDSGDPLPQATVAVYTVADTTFVTGTTTEMDGTFEISGLRPRTYRARVSFVGYVTRSDEVQIRNGETTDIGRVVMQPDSRALGEARVEAEREAIEQQADRTVYNVDEQAVSAGGNALNTLETLPSVEVDTEGSVSLRGGRNVAIHINGRPTPISGQFLANFLRQIPAENIERVEVIPNPSARYDAEGMSGIINIVLKERAPDRGLAGGLTLGGGTDPSANVAGNLSYQKGAVDVYGSYGFRYDDRVFDSGSIRDYINPQTDSSRIAAFDRTEDGSRNFIGNFGNATLDYTLAPGAVLSLNGNLSVRDGNNDNSSVTSLTFDGGSTNREERLVEGDSDGLNASTRLGFQKRFDAEGQHTLDLEGRLSLNDDLTDELYVTRENQVETRRSSYLEDESEAETYAQLDYVRPVGDIRVETGGKITWESIRNEVTIGNSLNTSFEQFDDGSFDYDRSIYAAYAQAAVPFGDFEAQAGLRVENASRNFSLIDVESDTPEVTEQSYTDLFPSAFLLYNVSPGTLVKGSYSRRINRPRTWFLSPFSSRDDPYTQRLGNPNLRPEYTNAFELTLQYKYALTVTPFYRRTTDAISRAFREEGETTFFTVENLATQDSYGADLTVSAPLGPARGFVSGSLFRETRERDGAQVVDNTTWSLRASLQAELTPTTSAQFFGFFRGPRAIEDGSSSGFGFTNFAVTQKLMGDDLTLNLRLSDPFGTARFEFETFNDSFEQSGFSDFSRRTVAATLTYTFGRPERQRNRQGRQGGEMGGGEDDGFGI